MSEDLGGRIALVTGASRGIGLAIAQRLAAGGATVVVTARSMEPDDDHLAGSLVETVDLIRRAGGRRSDFPPTWARNATGRSWSRTSRLRSARSIYWSTTPRSRFSGRASSSRSSACA